MTGVHRCGENARKGTGYGICDGILDPHGECSNAGNHVYSDREALPPSPEAEP